MPVDPNIYFVIILATVVGLYLLDLASNLLNLKALSPDLPEEFADTYDPEKYRESQEYTRVTTRFGFLESAVSLAIFLAFWFLGGFEWLDQFARGFGFGPIITGLIFAAALFLAGQILDLPFEIYDTFVIEEKFGFNKTSPLTFTLDLVKGLALSALLGLPILALLLYLFSTFQYAWLIGWIAVSGFSLLLVYLAPRFILPLFNKFSPLEDGELKSAIHAMAEKCRFPLTEVSVMDGSKRSSKSNAFFTGFGKNKKIALFDTLIENHGTQELVAVLAHEIGHFKKKHIHQGIAIGILQTGLLFFVFNFFLNNKELSAAFGVTQTSVYMSLVLFALLFKPINKILSVLLAMLSRKNEFEADAYAATHTGSPESLVTALKKLSADNLSNLTPHPLLVFLSYSHPPTLQRIAALRTHTNSPG
ncbi:MAG: M48 family metallopeptidase [Verrucomicrobiota bacterium]